MLKISYIYKLHILEIALAKVQFSVKYEWQKYLFI